MRSGISTPSADLQYKVESSPRCQSFDREGRSRCGCNKIKVSRVDISVLTASSQKYTMKPDCCRTQGDCILMLLGSFDALSN